MKIALANVEAEAIPDIALCDADRLHPRELRKALAEYIETQREAVKARRRKLN